MKRTHLLTALATAALVAGGPALAQGRGGGHGGGHGIGASAHGGLHGRDFGVRTRTDARLNSQGPAHANARARARANQNSVLATGRTTSDLTLLRNGLVVQNTAGTRLGTIARINRTRDGRIVNVLVRDRATGHSRTIPVSASTLTINGDVVTTTYIPRSGGNTAASEAAPGAIPAPLFIRPAGSSPRRSRR